ncbi:MAG: hypothetical protein HC855_12985 [Rhizobiales bacterium]|nr:hypothetical protein [Hyphomicrobiales bacterium]
MTTQTLILKEPRSATSFWHKLGNRCRAVAKAIRPRLADDELTAAQLYDVGLSDRRPVAPVPAEQRIANYSKSVSAMLNRSI